MPDIPSKTSQLRHVDDNTDGPRQQQAVHPAGNSDWPLSSTHWREEHICKRIVIGQGTRVSLSPLPGFIAFYRQMPSHSAISARLRVHSGKRPYTCRAYADCQKTSTRRTTLTRQRTVSDSKPVTLGAKVCRSVRVATKSGAVTLSPPTTP